MVVVARPASSPGSVEQANEDGAVALNERRNTEHRVILDRLGCAPP